MTKEVSVGIPDVIEHRVCRYALALSREVRSELPKQSVRAFAKFGVDQRILIGSDE